MILNFCYQVIIIDVAKQSLYLYNIRIRRLFTSTTKIVLEGAKKQKDQLVVVGEGNEG